MCTFNFYDSIHCMFSILLSHRFAEGGTEYSSNFVSPVQLKYSDGVWCGSVQPEMLIKVNIFITFYDSGISFTGTSIIK